MVASQHDAQVKNAKIKGLRVKQVLMYRGISSDILFLKSLMKAKKGKEDLKKVDSTFLDSLNECCFP